MPHAHMSIDFFPTKKKTVTFTKRLVIPKGTIYSPQKKQQKQQQLLIFRVLNLNCCTKCVWFKPTKAKNWINIFAAWKRQGKKNREILMMHSHGSGKLLIFFSAKEHTHSTYRELLWKHDSHVKCILCLAETRWSFAGLMFDFY